MEEDLNRCPGCLGEADNGHDRCVPPSAYYCTKCVEWLDARGQFLRDAAGIDTNFDLIDKDVRPSEINLDRWVDIFARYYCRLLVDDVVDWVNDNVGLMTDEARFDLYKRFGVESVYKRDEQQI